MASADYDLHSEWSVHGSPEEVYAVLIDVLGYIRWWPEVYLDVEVTAPGDEDGLGSAAKFLTKGKLNYTLAWAMQVSSTNYPVGFTLDATGDLVGRGAWAFKPQGDQVHIRFDWHVRTEKPLLKHFSFIFKPIVKANYRWAMSRGQEGLVKELQRRRKPKRSK